jgi:predicted phage terminase large subunit-like protein
LRIPFETEAQRQQCELPLCLIQNHDPKVLRIRRLGPALSQGRIRFRTTPGTRLLVDQLRQFPTGAYDDGPDALEMARRLSVELWNKAHTPGSNSIVLRA